MMLRTSITACLLLLMIAGSMAQQLKIMSYNIHHGRNGKGAIDLDKIAAIIKESEADLVGLQEVDSVCGRSGKVDQMRVLANLTGMHYAFKRHFAYDGGAYGLGILSKYPIANVEGHRISSHQNKTLVFLTADITLSQQEEVHFGTVHLDYRKDPAVRLRQSAEVTDYLKSIDDPIILTGDLNAEPDKQEIKNLLIRFTDTDSEGTYTFPAKNPVKKIDYILISTPHFKQEKDHEVIEEAIASDHRPVTATVILKW